MVVGNEITAEIFTLRYRIQEDTNNPKFSTGKLFHIIQNICHGYSGEFSIKRLDVGYVFEDGSFHEAEDMIIRVSGVSQNEADEIAADLCAFLCIKEVKVSRNYCQYHMVTDSL